MFSASVAFFVKTMCEGSGAWKSSARSSRVLRTVLPAWMDFAWPDLPGLPPPRRIAALIARGTLDGLGQDVAALSRYNALNDSPFCKAAD